MINNSSGFSLLEILVALVILSLLTIPFFNNIIQYSRMEKRTLEHYKISMEAQNLMEYARQLTFSELFQKANEEYLPWNDYYIDLKANCSFWNDENFFNLGIVFKQTEQSFYCYVVYPESVSRKHIISSMSNFEISLSFEESELKLILRDENQVVAEENIICEKPVKLHLFTYEKDDNQPVTVILSNFNSNNLSVFLYDDLFNIDIVTFYVNDILAVVQDDSLTAQDLKIPYKVYKSEKQYTALVETIVDVYENIGGDVLLRRHGFFNISY